VSDLEDDRPIDEAGPAGLPDRPDPRTRPDDPAGTKPKFDPDSLLPAVREPLISADPDGEVVDGDLLPEPVGAAGSPAPVGPLAESPHAPRFQFLLGAFFALGLAAVAALVAVAVQGKQHADTSWSVWHPSGNDTPSEIAAHVSREYHLGTGDQLVAVTGGPLEVAGLPLTIALRQPATQGGDISLINGKSVLYRLCGLGSNCAIPIGKPSVARHLLLRREALELALYTFHYTNADNVVAFLPPATIKPIATATAPATAKPAKPQTVTEAIFLRRSDVDQQLSHPLTATLTRTTPLPTNVASSPDADFVERVTTARLFDFSLTQANQDNRAFLVLQPLS
jgi:hypothetical protein